MNKLLICLIFFLKSVTGFAQQKPNIILILSDDAGYADFSFQSKRLIPTPNIDRIAQNGASFTNAYVTGAVCGPSRAGILTGVNQAEFGHVYNFLPYNTYTIPKDSFGIPVSQKLIGNYLKPLGYTSGIVGKWHEGYSRSYHPNQRGFDYFWGFLDGSSNYKPGLAKGVQENGRPVPADSIPYMTDAIGNQSLKFIEANASHPFFLYVAFNAVHTPLQAKPELLEKYKKQFSVEGRALNAALTESLDENVGRILNKLSELKLLENTIVVFTNDNGGSTASFADNYPLRGSKAEIYEGGIRVPMSMMWKGKIKAGTRYEHPVSTLDFLPTFLNAAEAQAEKIPQIAGDDLVKRLQNKKKVVDRPMYWYIGWANTGAIRLGDYKMIFSAKKGPELYNLTKDIAETTNLVESETKVAKKLEEMYKVWRQKLPKPLWEVVKSGNGSE
ncbi:sulfatase-like hydrolase/transferase [Terrimonas pollutisoli]|uniref:sulfatase-like hydrolase/transferase n=1 Tax=Terrimonas pollutisoli TaxID=3034147 RepID=UPI0023EA975F|nr:sulfatase-like hydrolase/transferase [Terrimonas sp. H1YJ31]